LKQEFIVFDLRRSKIDPLSIRVRWDKPLEVENSVNIVQSIPQSKFNIAGQEAILIAKKENRLVEFAGNFPLPPERKKLLAEGVTTKNADIWARLVYREAFGIKNKDLGSGWHDFAQKIKEGAKLLQNNEISIPQVESRPDKNLYFLRYKDLLDSRPLDDKKYIEGCEILTWLLSNGHIDQKIHRVGIKELNDS
jgi:hypothetical protein